MLKKLFIVSILLLCAPRAWSLTNAERLQAGTAYAEQGMGNKAIPLLKMSLPDETLDAGKRAKGYYALGLAYAQKDRDAETVDALTKCLSLDDKMLKAYLLLGMTHDLAGRPEQALLVYRRGVKALPGQGRLLRELGLTELMLNHIDDGVRHLQAAVKRNPDSPELRADLGYALLQAGRYKKAIDSLTEALALGPADADLLTHLGDACAGAHKNALAIKHYQHALSLKPEKDRARYHLGLMLMQQGEDAKAISQFRRVLRHNPKHRSALMSLAAVLARTQGKNRQEAKRILQRALQQDPSYSAAYLGLAQIALSEGDLQEARRQVQAGLARDKKNAKLINMLDKIKQELAQKNKTP